MPESAIEWGIQAIEFREAVRKRPRMFFKEDGDPFTNLLVREALCHAVEEILLERATEASVQWDGELVVVADDGPGWSGAPHKRGISDLEMVLTQPHAGCRAKHLLDRVREEVCVASIAAVNALSSSMLVDSMVGGDHWRVTFADGVTSEGPVRIGDANRSGLRLAFRPWAKVVANEPFDPSRLIAWWRGLDFPLPREALKVIVP